MQRFEQTPRPTAAVAAVWRHEETRRVRCTARRTQASEPTLTASGLSAKRRADCARVIPSWYIVFHNVTDCCCCCSCCGIRVRNHGEVCAVRSSWSLGLSPRQPTVVWPRRDAPTARRARNNVAIQVCPHSTHRSFCCCLLSRITY